LAQGKPKLIVYVSCDPMTWGRDGQLFLKETRASGTDYRIATIHGLDMFPQTDHIEVFSVFERKD
jgi:tRNA/tmRNA/rRNA uracil-C5-methylase (TrmA/RlmC/RlmD family)